MVMRKVVSTGETLLKWIVKSTPECCVFDILLQLISIFIKFLLLIPLAKYSFLLYFRENCIWSFPNYIWRCMIFSLLFLIFNHHNFLGNWLFYLWISILTFHWASWSFPKNSFRNFVFIDETRNVIFWNVKLKLQQLSRVEGAPMELRRDLYYAFSVFLTFHVFKNINICINII